MSSNDNKLRSRKGGPLPVVTCPGCLIAMTPIRKTPVVLTDMIEVRYCCEKCKTETARIIKDD